MSSSIPVPRSSPVPVTPSPKIPAWKKRLPDSTHLSTGETSPSDDTASESPVAFPFSGPKTQGSSGAWVPSWKRKGETRPEPRVSHHSTSSSSDSENDSEDEDLSRLNPYSDPVMSSSCPSRVPFKNSGFPRHRSQSKPSEKLLQQCLQQAKFEMDFEFHSKKELESRKGKEMVDQMEKRFIMIEEAMKNFPHLDPVELTSDGVNGSYLMKDKLGKILGIFKPKDEESGAPNNPRRHPPKNNNFELSFENVLNESPPSPENTNSDANTQHGILPQEAAIREVVAYLIDDNFAGVPPTVMAHACYNVFFDASEAKPIGSNHSEKLVISPTKLSLSQMSAHLENRCFKTKHGSFQVWVENDGSCEDTGWNFPADALHRIGVLDIMLLNTDRHSGNILQKKDPKTGTKLIPIDHGFCLPDSLEKVTWFDWMSWPQAKQPFSAETLRYIASINIQNNMDLLGKYGIRPDCIELSHLAHLLLKSAAQYGLSLYEIASMLCRSKFFDQPTEIEQLVSKAWKRGSRIKDPSHSSSGEDFLTHFSTLLDSLLKQKKSKN